jgi:A/G-specific adenine glycosylase
VTSEELESSSSLSPARRTSLRQRLIEWYLREQRSLPWRESRDAYRIWVSESMLQQTRVETVLGYWPRFVERFPTLVDLAESDEDDVLAVWSGLGYYSRARKLRAAAQVVVKEHGGDFPRTRIQAVALPGVGPYTAGAVLSIAYDLPEALVDGNVQRVFCRLFGLEDEVGSSTLNKQLWSLAEQLVPEQGAGTWNQALMELGATVCQARKANCEECPVSRGCLAKKTGRVAQLPRPKAKRAPTEVELQILVVKKEGKWLLEQRPTPGRMAGLWQFPTVECAGSEGELFPVGPPKVAGRPILEVGEAAGSLRHSITRYRIRATIHSAQLVEKKPATWRWFQPEELQNLAITGMARKVLAARNDSAPFRH